jgi:hypothetical protein
MATKKQLNVLITDKEMEFLEKYCDETGHTRTAVIRQLIRELEAHTDGTKQRNRFKAAKAATG